MNPKTRHELWEGKAGPIEVSIDEPAEDVKGLAVIAHPHPLFGGTKDNKVVQTLARAFLQLGYVTVRFNFRGVGQSAGAHDNGDGETSDMVQLTHEAKVKLLPATLQNQPVAMAGFSFGAFVTTHAAEQLRKADVAIGKMVLVGTATSRFTVAPVPEDTLVIHGEVDDTVPLTDVLRWAGQTNVPVVVMPGVEHFFHGKLPQLKELVVRYYPS
ncbi:alpha/beta hydrolase [Limnobacter parvus]|uniref:Alpha/beta fold hydrolase n=1 Tax=Limnobacter parvus TaxID=2939690 RepID=A0ABT1XIH7_9BURK|nr:alpha/beta fold hydrolase [Limnobacter parvus]MCR2747083.1 alpha/beta fold hydrolase [Limnobacter parvus]